MDCEPMSDPLDPTGLQGRRANVRGTAQTHGAATDSEAVRAYVQATTRRRTESTRTAVVVTREPRGYTLQDHERAESLRGEAAALRRIAAEKREDHSRRLVEREAANLERDAETIVPIVHARAGWR
jgi:hypothetical protein